MRNQNISLLLYIANLQYEFQSHRWKWSDGGIGFEMLFI